MSDRADNIFTAILAGGNLSWLRWGAAALAQAQEREVPIMVLCGEACDHWSAVLAAELHADAAVQELLGGLFVAVVAERLENPALAARCQEVLALRADASGFPLIAFATPTGEFFGAVPWRPLHDREQQVGLTRILVAVAETWADDRDAILADATEVQRLLSIASQRLSGSGKPLRPQLLLESAESALVGLGDSLEGGFGPTPRSLGTAAVRFLAARARREDAPLALIRLLERTVLAWAHGAVCDQLGGGMHRGSVDAGWRQPFFEQRLIDQAQTALAWLDAAEALDRPALRVAAERCLRWTIDHLRLTVDTYAAGFHADAPGVDGQLHQGAYQCWTIAEIASFIGEDAADLVVERFALSDAPIIDGAQALAVRAPVTPGSEVRLAAALQRLAVARSERTPPLRDERPDQRGEGLLLCALARLRSDHADLATAGAALAERYLHAEPVAPAAGDGAAVALGLVAWSGATSAARAWLASEARHRDERGRVQVGAERFLEPAPLAAVDDDRGDSAAALVAEAYLRCGDDQAAHALLVAHGGVLTHGAAAAGLLRVLDGLAHTSS